jgi:ferredoxin
MLFTTLYRPLSKALIPGLLPRSLKRCRTHCDGARVPNAQPVAFSFVKKGVVTKVQGLEGDNLVHVAHEAGVELEGACACSLACSTCHVILEAGVYNQLEAAGEEEEDLLDLAFGLTPT